MYEELKKELYEAHLNLEKYRLVAYTSGNVSVRIDKHVIIKPSGVSYDKLKAEDMVVIDLEGKVVEGTLKPSVDSATHLYLYKQLEDVKSIIHTHSPYASSFALLNQTLPVYSTAHADVFGTEIPVSNYAPVGSEAIGKAVIQVVNQARAVLLSKHGVIVMGKDISEAVRKAIFLEEVAQTAYLAKTMGNPQPLDKEEAQRLFTFHHSHYGQTK